VTAHELLTGKWRKVRQNKASLGGSEKAKSPSTLGQQAFDEKFEKLTAEREGVEPICPSPYQ
jgi:hypothetical protein